MLNSRYKKESLSECRAASDNYKAEFDKTVKESEKLYRLKEKTSAFLRQVEAYAESIANKPMEIETIISEVVLNRQAFSKEIEELELEGKKSSKASQSVAGAGITAGVGVAAFAPTAALGIATTFGTASTGTAIAALSGAAQINAALAWLGGGALVAGGGGMAAGNALLALAGPIGWAIGGSALLGSALLLNSKNKKIAAKAEQQTKEIKAETVKIKKLKTKVAAEEKAIRKLLKGASADLEALLMIPERDYKCFTNETKNLLMTLMNTSQTLSRRIGVKIS